MQSAMNDIKELRREWLSRKDQKSFHGDVAFELPGKGGESVPLEKALWENLESTNGSDVWGG